MRAAEEIEPRVEAAPDALDGVEAELDDLDEDAAEEEAEKEAAACGDPPAAEPEPASGAAAGAESTKTSATGLPRRVSRASQYCNPSAPPWGATRR